MKRGNFPDRAHRELVESSWEVEIKIEINERTLERVASKTNGSAAWIVQVQVVCESGSARKPQGKGHLNPDENVPAVEENRV